MNFTVEERGDEGALLYGLLCLVVMDDVYGCMLASHVLELFK